MSYALPKELSQLMSEDMINGHCETCAIALSAAVVTALHGGSKGRDAMLIGYNSLHNTLRQSSISQQIETLFAAERRSLLASDTNRQFLMWQPLLGVASKCWPTDSIDPETVLCAGIGTAAATAISEAARQTQLRSGNAQIATLPLYTLNYIWDGDELSDAQLGETHHETALFSLHVVGIVLNGNEKTALLCDPNGELIEGGSMEFLRIPIEELANSLAPSTSNSRYDRDLAASQSTRQKRRRK
jgi:hypothetical protein